MILIKMSRQRVLIGVKKYYQHPVVSNYSASKDGEIINIKTQRIMKMSKSRNGYHLFSLSDKKLLKQKTYYEHRFFLRSLRLLLNISSNALLTVSVFLSFRGLIHPYLLNTFIAINKYFIPLFHLLNFCISTKSAAQISSIPFEITDLFEKFLVIGL